MGGSKASLTSALFQSLVNRQSIAYRNDYTSIREYIAAEDCDVVVCCVCHVVIISIPRNPSDDMLLVAL